MKKILIAYFTKTNSTKEYAQYIKEQLQSKELNVDVVDLLSVENLHNYNAVIIGAPIYGMRWNEECVNFIKANQIELKKVPTFYFFVSYVFENGRKMWRKTILKSMDKVSKLVKPNFIGKFNGRIEKRMPRFIEFMFGIKKETPLNLMNYDKVDEFVNIIKETLK
ncbi:MAG: flavodoxin domain-containing protein [Clostridia bacterium]|nr:flavodoxin domain-containing protein [Clostridia bacterium]